MSLAGRAMAMSTIVTVVGNYQTLRTSFLKTESEASIWSDCALVRQRRPLLALHNGACLLLESFSISNTFSGHYLSPWFRRLEFGNSGLSQLVR